MIFLLVGVACSPSEQQGSRQEDQGAQPTTEEGARAGERTGTDLAGLLNEPAYRTVADDTKALRNCLKRGRSVASTALCVDEGG